MQILIIKVASYYYPFSWTANRHHIYNDLYEMAVNVIIKIVILDNFQSEIFLPGFAL